MSQELTIGHLNYGELQELRDRIDAAMKKKKEEGAPLVARRIAEEAAAHGLKPDDLLREVKKAQRGAGRRKREEADDPSVS
jgi:hypothetical protein